MSALRRIITNPGGPMMKGLAVLIGGLAGSATRAGITLLLPHAEGTLPAATLVANLSGAFLLGFYLGKRERSVVSAWSLELWAIGGFGSLTTFSAFAIEVVDLLGAGAAIMAMGYAAASVIAGLILSFVGYRIGASV